MTPDTQPDGLSPAEVQAANYLRLTEEGRQPDAEALASELASDVERSHFRELIDAARSVQSVMPVQVRPGTVLGGRYRILSEIGAGGMGKVFAALDEQLERKVAVKVLATFGTQAFDPEQQFRREAVLLAGMQHRNIVPVHEVGHEGDVNFLVMELVDGTPLDEVLAAVSNALALEGEVTPRRGDLLTEAIAQPAPGGSPSLVERGSWFRTAGRVMLEIVRTLEAAHGRQLVHRDIKPKNILLRGDGSPVILDFGLAGVLDHEGGDVTKGLFGSVAYLAPEQAATGHVGADPRTDVYQLGAVLYEMLTLTRAFAGDSVTNMLQDISVGKFTRPRLLDRGIPFELEAICLKAMELEPGRRYASAVEMGEDLERYVSGSELPLAARGGRTGSMLRQARYSLRRHKLVSGIAAALVLGVLGTWWLVPSSGGQGGLDPVLGAFAFRPADDGRHDDLGQRGTLARDEEIEAVSVGDVLGVTVRSEKTTYVYALSVFGEKAPPSYIVPMEPQVVGVSLDELEYDGNWALVLGPGDWDIKCTEIVSYDPDVPYEGLWVFTSDKPQPRLERWMDALDQRALRSADGLVSYAEARMAFDRPQPPVMRGGKVALTEEQEADLQSQLTSRALMDEDWVLPDPRRYQVFFPTAP